MHKLPQAA